MVKQKLCRLKPMHLENQRATYRKSLKCSNKECRDGRILNAFTADIKRQKHAFNKCINVTKTPAKAYYTKDLVAIGPLTEL